MSCATRSLSSGTVRSPIRAPRTTLICAALGNTPLSPAALSKSGWLSHLTTLLHGASTISHTLHLGNSHILIHCSDGWDRTSQLSSLAQILLDPQARTGLGFARGVEKDWGSFGHKFAERIGWVASGRTVFEEVDAEGPTPTFLDSVRSYAQGGSKEFKETCPVFLQYLDCIFQIMRQHPTRFEFGETFLVEMFKQLTEGTFGSFLWDSERLRGLNDARGRTHAVWERFFDLCSASSFTLKPEFLNPLFDPSRDDPKEGDMGVLEIDPLDVRWFHVLFGRGEEEMSGPDSPILVSPQEKEPLAVVVEGPVGERRKLFAFQERASPSGSTSSLLPSLSIPPPSATPPPLPPLPNLASPLPARTPPPSQQRSDRPERQEQLNQALESASKAGWGAWRSLKKGYLGAVEDWGSSSSPPPLSGSANGTNGVGAAGAGTYKPYVPSARQEAAEPNPWSTPAVPVESPTPLAASPVAPVPIAVNPATAAASSVPTLANKLEEAILEDTDPLGVGFT